MPIIKEIISVTPKPQRKRKRTKKNKTKLNDNTLMVYNAPVSKNVKRKPRVARMRQVGQSFVVTHREYISDVTAASAAFSIIPWAGNPGVSSSFPWLATIANRYESYIFDKLDFIYEPICPTTTPGSILMAMDYDASDTPPSTKVQMMSYKDSVRTSPWDRRVFRAASSDLRKFGIQRYTRSSALAANQDIKTYDVGTFYIASQNTPATTTTLGELYVEYTVRLFTPQIPTTVQAAQSNRVSQVGSINIPAVGIPTFSSIVETLSPHPMCWLDQRTTTTGPVRLLFNFLSSTNGIFRISGTNPTFDSGGLLRTLGGMAPSGSIPGIRMNLLSPLSTGFPQTNAANLQQYTYLFKGSNATSGAGVSGIFPLQIQRPPSGSDWKFDVSFFPTESNLPVATSFPTTSGTWDFPAIELPVFTSVSASRAMIDTEINKIVRVDQFPTYDTLTKKSLFERLTDSH